ncbi:MAG: hypothetical protein ACJARS_002642 [bacterium]|jgi:hypothetical protein
MVDSPTKTQHSGALEVAVRASLIITLGLIGCGETAVIASPDPGTVTLRRLSRTQVDRSLRDLFDIGVPIAMQLPNDDVGNGFDNQADVLSLSPLHIEVLDNIGYELTTYHVFPTAVPVRYQRVEAEDDSVTTTSGGPGGGGWNLYSNGVLSTSIATDEAGPHTFTVQTYGQQAGPDPVRLRIDHDGEDSQIVDVDWSNPQPLDVEWELGRGFHTVNVAFINDFYIPATDTTPSQDRNAIIDWVELSGPFDTIGPTPPGYGKVFSCLPTPAEEPACARSIAQTFGTKVWRRPLTETEVAQLADLYDTARESGEDPDRAVGWMVRSLLMSPNFLFRVELDPSPTDTTPHALNEFELATRLSYFLWSSTPDEQLLSRAAEGRLSDAEELAQQVERMLEDPRASALVDGLGAQWLSIAAIDESAPDPDVFPEWTEILRQSMAEEMRRHVQSVLLEDRSMRELLTSDTTFIDSTLAVHYGLAEPLAEWQQVDLSDTNRAGLLTTAGWLTSTSYPERTSPVRRGKWVLDNLLCESPAPPPPGVEALGTPSETGRPSTIDLAAHATIPQQQLGQPVRDRLEEHQTNPVCQSCHQSIDPIGYAFENYDSIGAWRNTDEGRPVDASGRLPDGFTFEGSTELVGRLSESRKFDRCVVQKTLTWALGRAPGVQDLIYLDAIESEYAASDRRFKALVTAIVLSDPFQQRRGVDSDDTPLPSLEVTDE